MDDSHGELGELVRAVVQAELGVAIDGLRQFVDRRITELSVEIHGTAQLLDFSEANLSGQLARIQQEIGRVVAAPALAAVRGSRERSGRSRLAKAERCSA